ncbi:MAG: hypothetical protein P4L92_10100 [Rudaea sp.]|nr:hypothetical protein [Rudaea sp.]
MDNYNTQMKQQGLAQQPRQTTSQQPVEFATGRDFTRAIDQGQGELYGIAIGYALGMFELSGVTRMTCPSSKVTDFLEVANVVYAYIKAHRADVDNDMIIPTSSAFIEKWPCPKRH